MLGGPVRWEWAEPSPLFAHRARLNPLKCKNENPVLPLGEETAVQAVVIGSIVWACSQVQKAKVSGDERPRLHALQRLPPTFLPFPSMEQNYNPLRPFKTPADFSSRSIEADSSHLS